MLHAGVFAHEVGTYTALAEKLRVEFEGVDDETLRDTLEGLSDLPQLIEELVRSSLQDEALAAGLKGRIADMGERLARFEERARRKRDLACKAMSEIGLKTLKATDFSAGLREGRPQLVIEDERLVPSEYLLPQPPKLDRTSLTAALKLGSVVAGARLDAGRPHIAVRVK